MWQRGRRAVQRRQNSHLLGDGRAPIAACATVPRSPGGPSRRPRHARRGWGPSRSCGRLAGEPRSPASSGITTWKASAAVAAMRRGLVSGSTIFSCSMIGSRAWQVFHEYGNNGEFTIFGQTPGKYSLGSFSSVKRTARLAARSASPRPCQS